MDTEKKKLFFIICFLFLFWGCKDNDDIKIWGIASVGEPIQGATVQIYDKNSNPIVFQSVSTNENGVFSVLIDKDYTEYMTIEISGGIFAESKNQFDGRLYSIVSKHDTYNHSFYHIGPFSTITAYYAFENPTMDIYDCWAAVKNYFAIKDSIDNENDLYFYNEYFDPVEFLSKALEYGGVKIFCEVLACDISNPNNQGADSFFSDNDIQTELGSSDIAIFIGKELAKGALSEAGGQAAGWILGNGSGNSMKDFGDKLDKILFNQEAMLQKLDMNAFQDKIDKVSNIITYFESFNKSLYLFTQCNATDKDKNNFYDNKLINKDIETDLLIIHKNLMGNTLSNGLFDMYDSIVENGPKYYSQMEAFMMYWSYQQELGLNLWMEQAHREGTSDGLIAQYLMEYAKQIDEQTKKFLSLIEQNFSFDWSFVKTFEDKHICDNCTGKDVKPDYYGYDFHNSTIVNFHKANWSHYPQAKYSDTYKDDCQSTMFGPICNRYLTRTGKESFVLNPNFVNSSELDKADELVHGITIFQDPENVRIQDGKLVPIASETRAIVFHGLLCPFMFDKLNISLEDILPVLTIINTDTGIESTIQPEFATIKVPAVYYTKDPEGDGGTGQVVRYVGKDIPYGSYEIDVDKMNNDYSFHLLRFITFNFLSKNISYKLNYQKDAIYPNMMFMLYPPY